MSEAFEKVEVTDIPGTMPKPATNVSYVSYSVAYPTSPIDYNTTFTRVYPVQDKEESGSDESESL